MIKTLSNSTGHKKVKLTWDSYIKLLYKLCEKIKQSNIDFDFAYGPARGGLIPVTVLSHYLNKPILEKSELGCVPESFNVLVIDDLVDTLITVVRTKGLFRPGTKVFTATLYKHKKCKFVPDFYIEENSNWISFPYEKDE